MVLPCSSCGRWRFPSRDRGRCGCACARRRSIAATCSGPSRFTARRRDGRRGRPAGVDGGGEVHAVGEGVSGFRPGDRVMFRGRGCFAEHVVVDPALATPIPPHLGWEEAAAIPTAFVTAWEAMVQYGRVK